MKKITSLILAMAMVFSLSAQVFALNDVSQTARSVVKQTGCFVGRSREAVSGGRCVLSPPDCFVA